jgi:hypothetical protein
MAEPSTQQILTRFAATISKQPPGLVTHAPEPWADPMHCVGNVMQKVSREGGRAVFGWVFLDRHSPEYGDYLIAQHHAVWCAAGSTVAVDIKPFHENPRHRPYCHGGSVLFLLDDAAQPRIIGQVVAPLASQFFPATNDPKLATYIETLSAKEHAQCQEVYEAALAAQPGLERLH